MGLDCDNSRYFKIQVLSGQRRLTKNGKNVSYF